MPGDGPGQAQFFAAQVGALGPGEFWVVDIEPDGPGKPPPSPADVNQFVVEAVARLGPRGLLHGNQSDLAASAAATTARANGIGGLILANYGVNDGTRHALAVPAGWPAVGHQYTSRGRVPGVVGPVDRDYWLGDLASLQAFAGVASSTGSTNGSTNGSPREGVGELPVEVIVQSFSIPSQAVSHLGCSTGGAWLLTQSGNVYALGGAPYFGSPAENQHGENWLAGGRAARAFQARTDGKAAYVVVDQRNETFAYPA